nr:endo-1,4-beta-xylanase [Eubacterium sp.]
MKRIVAKCMVGVMVVSALAGSVAPDAEAAKKPKLKNSVVRVVRGKSKSIATKKVTKKTKVTIKQTKKSKKIVKAKWVKKSKKLKITGKKAGTTTLRVVFKVGKKTYPSKLKVVVSSLQHGCGLQTLAPTTTPEATVAVTTTPSVIPSATPSATPVITGEPTATPVPTFEAEYNGDDEMPIKEIYKDYFMMGAAINGSSLSTMSLHHKGMNGILLKHFDSTVLSNLMKPQYTLDQVASKASADGMPVCKFDTCDPALQFCMDNGLKMRGHTLVWHNQAPEWFFHEDYDTSNPIVDAETMDKRMESYIRQVITHCQDNYPGVIYCWDVVNECVCVDNDSYIVTEGGWKLRASTLQDNDFTHEEAKKNYWYASMGEGYVEKAFEYARKYADPEVKLFYNDYNPFQTEKMNNIYRMVEQLKEKDLIDGIGLQPTVGLTWPQLNSDDEGSFKVCLQTFAELGLELQVTELGFKIPNQYIEDGDEETIAEKMEIQTQRYNEFMGLLLEMDSDNGGPCNITSVTVFGICDDYPLYDDFIQNIYLWDKNCLPKPCFYSYIQPGLDLLAAKESEVQ